MLQICEHHILEKKIGKKSCRKEKKIASYILQWKRERFKVAFAIENYIVEVITRDKGCLRQSSEAEKIHGRLRRLQQAGWCNRSGGNRGGEMEADDLRLSWN